MKIRKKPQQMTFDCVVMLTLWFCVNLTLAQFPPSRKLISGTANKTEFIDLNIDVLHLIFDGMELYELLNMIKVHSEFLPISTAAFRKRYRDYDIDVINVLPNETSSGRESYFNDIKLKRIEIFKFDTFHDIMTKLGSAIQRLNIQNEYIDNKKLITINQYISKYGSATLTHLKLGKMIGDTLEQFEQPFEKVESLTFTIGVEQIRSGVLPLTQLFPRLRRLAVSLKSGNFYTWMNCHFPHLEHITAIDYVQKGTAQFEGIMSKNVHIKSFEVQQFVSECNFIEKIRELLTNVENLILHSFNTQGDRIHFDYVKNFTLHTFYPVSIEQLSFSRLESLDMKFSSTRIEGWLGFFKKHSHLSRLRFSTYDIERVRLAELLDELPNLIEMEIDCYETIDVEIICQIIENHKKMTKFRISLFNFDTDDMNTLRKKFQNQWHIQRFNSDRPGLTFEKKKEFLR